MKRTKKKNTYGKQNKAIYTRNFGIHFYQSRDLIIRKQLQTIISRHLCKALKAGYKKCEQPEDGRHSCL